MEKIEQPDDKLNGAQLNLEDGSMLGKFKDATSLLNAYNNLQAEFTRKSQKLAEITKQHAEELSEKDDASASSKSVEEGVTNKEMTASMTENCLDPSENSYCKNDSNNAEIDDSDTVLSKKLLEFAENQPAVINNIEDIKSEINANSQLLKLDNGIDIAYRLVKEKQKSEPAEIIKDPNFINDYILSNESITTAIIDRYIKSLASKNNVPKLISGDSKTVVATPNGEQPKTLNDANKIFQKMLEK